MKFGIHFSCIALGVSTLLAASAASAHVRLIEPPPRLDGRDGGEALKQGPCGQMENARTTTVTDFMGGETITVDFGEYINHASYYRIALDVDGDEDFPMRPEESVQQQGDDPASVHPLSDIEDTSLGVYILQYYTDDGGAGFMQEQMYTTEVTLPNIDCQNCTLQLIQFMYDDVEPHYFQCADITITAVDGGDTTTTSSTTSGAGGATGTSAATTGSTSASTTGTTGFGPTTAAASSSASTTGGSSVTTGSTSAVTTGGTSAATTGTPAVTGATGAGLTTGTTGTTGAPPADDAAEEEAGCSCRAAPGASRGSWLGALLGLGLLGYRRRPRAHS